MKVSVVIPVYNVEEYIGKTLTSLAMQTRDDFEVVIVNDGSTDNTVEIVGQFMYNSTLNIKLVDQPNSGVSAARNRGIREASGDYIFPLDGDDSVHPELMEFVYEAIGQHTPDTIFWDWMRVSETGEYLDNYPDLNSRDFDVYTGETALRQIVVHRKIRMIAAMSAIYSKRVIEERGIFYTEGCASGEDQEFTLKNLAVSDKVVHIQKTMSFYLQRKTSITGSYNIRKFDYLNAFKRTANFITQKRPELRDVSEVFLGRNMIENYFYNIDTCLSASRVSIFKVLKDLDKHYPGANQEIVESMKNWPAKYGYKNRLVDAYLLSPFACQLLLSYRHLKDSLKGRRAVARMAK